MKKKAMCKIGLAVMLLLTPMMGWSAKRLNIVIIVGDDWGGPYASAYTGIYGRNLPSNVVKTPNVDRIAQNGVLFKNAYVNAPSCTPSRSSIFTGRYFFNTGGGAVLGGTWDFTIPSFPLLLLDAGYHIGLTSKGWSPGTPRNAPFGGTAHYYQYFGTSVSSFSKSVTKWTAKGMPFEKAKQTMLDQVRGNFEAFLADRKPDQPFFYWFGPTNTHRTWVKGSGKALWGIEPDSLKDQLPVYLPNNPEVREDMADYLGEIQALDAYIGVLLKKLEEIGELDNTIIVATGDNGPGGFPRGKWNLYDFGVATPLVVWYPHSTGGRVVTDFTTLMDLAPTFLEVAGVAIPPKTDGRSLLNILTSPLSGQVDPQRTFAITGEERHNAKARDDSLPYPARALRTARYLYIRNFAPDRWPMGCPYVAAHVPYVFHDIGEPSPTYDWIITNRSIPSAADYFTWAFAKRPAEELYDAHKDPGQINNVADDPMYADIKKSLAEKLLAELKKAGDPRVIGDGGTFDRPPYTDLKTVACQDTIPLNWAPGSHH
ncbi:sulfatase family protein [Methylovulum psychrotolerans]|nr:sulfatase [Methylovulum psychrotolerans]